MTARVMEEQLAETVARRLGLKFDEAVVIGTGMNVLVHLQPVPVVARVTRLAHLVRTPDALEGGIGLAKALGERAVAPPALLDPGPHVEAGRYVTFRTYRPGEGASSSVAGAALRSFHEEGATYRGSMRTFDPRPEALRIADLVGGEPAEILRDAAARLVLPDLPQQPIHGDAHFGNVLAAGVWQDFDEACVGPKEWDLACMIHRWAVFGLLEDEMRDALAAYGQHDHAAVGALQPLVVLCLAAWGSLAEDRAEIDALFAPGMRVAVGEYRGRGAVRAELTVRLRGEVGDGVDRDAELGGDVLVRAVAADAVEDEALPLGERVRTAR